MKVIISVIGKDNKGIIAGVSNILANNNINIVDISQTILTDTFAMIMQGDFSEASISIKDLREELTAYGLKQELNIHVQHEDIYKAMHRV